MSRLRAHAKINLGLRILDRRPDGYHNIETIFHRIDLFDEIAVEPHHSIVVECTEPSLSGEGNLCHRAAMLLAETFDVGTGARILLDKNIPVGAGLGGGSSDAATTLGMLNTLWDLRLGRDRLHELALALGSDVPFFLGDHTAHATSRGEALSFFPFSLPYAVVVVFPGIPVSTAAAYAEARPRERRGEPDLRKIIERFIGDPDRLSDLLTNDFEETVFRAHPEIPAVKEMLLSLGACFSLLSGSGSSVFGLFREPGPARHAADQLSDKYRTFFTPPGFAPSLHRHSN